MLRYLVFIFSVFCQAQTNPFALNGLVFDEQKKPITNASVLVKDNSYEYTLQTNEQGAFSKNLYDVGERISISISKPQYDDFHTEIIPNQEKYTFNLFPKSKEIEEITLKKGMVQKGDSTIYYADYYSNKKENKVIDLLKKLPNVDVNRNGKISVDGKEVDKVLVENETFFTGSSSLAINSLPADAVAKFEVIDNYQENSILGGDSEKMVLNIALKEEKKKLVFGDIFLNGNTYDRYKVGANNFFYALKTKINLISNLNNTNESAFSMEDYFSFNGGLDRLLRDPLAFMGNFNSKELLELLLPNEKYNNKQIFNALNISQNLFKNKLKLAIFNINNWNTNQEKKENKIEFNHQHLSSLARKEKLSRDVENKSNNFNLVLTNNHTKNIDFYYSLNLKNTNISTLQDKKIFFLDTQGNLLSTDENKGNNFNQVLDINYKLSENHAQGFLANILFSENIHQNLTQSDRISFFHPIFNLLNSQNDILQRNNDKSQQFRVNFQHKYNFFTHHQIGVNLNLFHKKQEIENEFKINSKNNKDLYNSLSIDRNNINLGLEYLFKNRSFTISLIGDFMKVNTDFQSNYNIAKTQNQFFLPTAKIEYKSRGLGIFNIDYKRNIREVSAHYYFSGNYLISNTTLFRGIENPNNPLNESLSFRYNLRSGYRGYSIDLRYHFSNKLKDYILDTETTSLQKTSIVRFVNHAGERNGFDITLEKQVFNKMLSLIFQKSIEVDKELVKINGVDAESKTNSKNFKFTARSRFKGNYNFEVYNHYSITDYNSVLSENSYKMNETGIMLHFSPTDQWIINTDISFNTDIENHISYSKSAIKVDYYLNSNIYANLHINNILGANRKILVNNEDVFSYHQQEFLMPRFFYLGLTYKF